MKNHHTFTRLGALAIISSIAVGCGSDGEAAETGSTPPAPPATAGSGTPAAERAEATSMSASTPGAESSAAGRSDVTTSLGTSASADCGTIRVAMNDSPQNRAVSWAIDNGLVSSDVVEVEVAGLPIPSLIEEAQSFANFDVVESAINGIAFGVSNGAPLVILGPGQVGKGTDGRSGALFAFVRSESEITATSDLAGARIATVAIGAATTQMMGVVLDANGIDPAVEGGDVTWLELPYDQMPVALSGGDVDYIISSHLAAYQSLQDPDLTLVGVIDDEYRSVSGDRPPVLTVLATITPKVAGRESCFAEARQLIAESYDYALANTGEVAAAVAQSFEGGNPEVLEPFIESWIGDWFDYVAVPTDEDVDAMQTQIDLGAAAGMNPPVDLRAITLPLDS